MTRPLRIKALGGWYHVFARGHNRDLIYEDGLDCGHFLKLLEEMRELYRVRVYAYCLMPNHYHLLVGTPEGNISRAIQWLNGSYGIWHGRKYNRTGHLFSGRFKSVLVEAEGWGLEVSVYVHMNPVATEEMGLGKKVRKAQRQGLMGPPSADELARRLKALREYRWSSYKGYAGYEKAANWLDDGILLRRAGGTDKYRELVEGRIKQGGEESVMAKVRWGVVLGGERFARKVRGRIEIGRESAGRKLLMKRRGFEEIVRMIEGMSRRRWSEFRDRHGEWWRDLTLWAARRYGGMKLAELGQKVGGVDYTAVAMALKRLEERSRKDRSLRSAMKAIKSKCEK
jgi:putative transposase